MTLGRYILGIVLSSDSSDSLSYKASVGKIAHFKIILMNLSLVIPLLCVFCDFFVKTYFAITFFD